MKITLKTAGTLGKYLPAGSSGNLAEVEVPDDATPAKVMAALGFPPENPYLVILNGATVPKAERTTRRLADGDKLAVMPPLKGG